MIGGILGLMCLASEILLVFGEMKILFRSLNRRMSELSCILAAKNRIAINDIQQFSEF